jgi:hypothetical protein
MCLKQLSARYASHNDVLDLAHLQQEGGNIEQEKISVGSFLRRKRSWSFCDETPNTGQGSMKYHKGQA